MNSFFHYFSEWLLFASFSGTVIATVILLIRRWVYDEIAVQWFFPLWGLLLIKLIFPYALVRSFSAFAFFSYLRLIPEKISSFNTQSDLRPIKAGASEISELLLVGEDYAISTDTFFFIDWGEALFVIWIIGAIIATVAAVVLNLRQLPRFNKGRKVVDGKARVVLEQCEKKLGIEGKIRLEQVDGNFSPALVGLFKPRLIIPERVLATLSEKELKHVMLHELAHYKRKDLFLSWLLCLLRIFHWFNPILWYTFQKMEEDREIACDNIALSCLSSKEYSDYGRTLIRLLECFSQKNSLIARNQFSGAMTQAKRRMVKIANYQRERPRLHPSKIVLLLLAGGTLFLIISGKQIDRFSDNKVTETPAREVVSNLEGLFGDYEGSFVLYDSDRNRYTIHNESKSVERFVPASTVKILLALILLEEGVLKSEESEIKWDGVVSPFSVWNQDHTLRSAMRYSVNWYFEKAVKRLEMGAVSRYLLQIGYGNETIAETPEALWNQPFLRISPMEQVTFLKRLLLYDLPFSKKSIDSVKKILKVAHWEGGTLYGKTGTVMVNGKATNGWFIGYLEEEGRFRIFSTHIQNQEKAGGIKARNITMAALKSIIFQ